uniref:Histone deacetylase 14 n=1 Tax=Tanacetum cinerariifolium TaxID=118510 RepID=A0A6L2KW35_TANCI|nr:hypothetical protein [Tanacetum cinerariifolium]
MIIEWWDRDLNIRVRYKIAEENIPAPIRFDDQHYPVDPAYPFMSPLAGEQVMDFVNELGYLEEIHFVSKILSIPSKKSTPYVIPYCRFTKLVIYYLGSRHNIHQRPEAPIHVTGDDFLLGNLKFVPKATTKKDEKNKTTFEVDKPKKPTPVKKPALAKHIKPMKEKSTKPTPLKKTSKGKVKKVRKGKSSLQLVDEDEEVQHEPEPQV